MHVDEIVEGVYKRTQKIWDCFGNVNMKRRSEDTEDSHDGEVLGKSRVLEPKQKRWVSERGE